MLMSDQIKCVVVLLILLLIYMAAAQFGGYGGGSVWRKLHRQQHFGKPVYTSYKYSCQIALLKLCYGHKII